MTTSNEELVPCPLCGASDGYTLTEGDTYRWWLVLCRGCGEPVTECRSDRRTTSESVLPEHWPAAEEAWNSAGAYAYALLKRAEAAEAALEERNKPCQWKLDDDNWYATGCGSEFDVPAKFCPDCGHPIEVQP